MSPILQAVNWDEIAKAEVIPPGQYATRIDKVTEKMSQNKNQYWFVEFTITEEPLVGRKVFGNFMLDVQSLWKLRQLLEALGWDVSGLADINSDELIGQEVGVVVDNETYEGQLRSRVKSFKKL